MGETLVITQSNENVKALPRVSQTSLTPSSPAKGKGAVGFNAGISFSAAAPAEENDDIYAQLSLPSPQQALLNSERVLGTDENTNIVMILSQVFSLQERINSNFTLISWNMGTESMKASISLANPIATEIKANFNAQAAISSNEGKMGLWQGITGIITGASTIAMGGVAAGKELKLFGTPEYENLTTPAGEENMAANSMEMEDLQNVDNQSDGGVKDTLSKATAGAKGGGATAGEFFYKTYEKVLQASSLANLGNQIGQGFSTWNYKTSNADHLRDAGKADAASKQFEQYVQWYNQNFGRVEDLRQATQNFNDQALQILKSISDIVASTTQSMFRG